MQSYKFRVTHKRLKLDEVLKVLPLEQPYAYAEELVGNENHHTHFLFQTDLTTHAVRARLKKIGLCGNEDYSLVKLKEQYPIEYIAYLVKGGEYISTLPVSVLEEGKQYDARVKSEMKESKKEKKTFLRRLEEGFPEWHKNRYSLAIECPWNYDEHVMEYIMEMHLEEGKSIRVYQLQALFDTLMCKYNKRYSYNMQMWIRSRYDVRK